MKRIALLGLAGTLCLGPVAFAQDSAATPTLPPPTQTSPPPQATTPPNKTGAPKTPQGKATEKQKSYNGNTGKKADAGTACSSARPGPNGGVDCGTSGNAATPPK